MANFVCVLCVMCLLLRVTGAVTTGSSFTSPPPVCPGSEATFTCSVVDPQGLRSTIWTVGSDFCGLSHSIAPLQQSCGSLFTAALGPAQGDCYTSNITATVGHDDNGLSVMCYAFSVQPERLVGNATLQVIASPPAPSSSCALTEGNGNTTRLTLSWTEPPSDDSIDQYCINSSPEYPSASSLCVGSSVRAHEYLVEGGLEYNFTLFAVNCDDQNGTETAPISVFPQVPEAPSTPEVSAVYNQSTNMLLVIQTSWSEVSTMVVSEQCDRGRELNYVVFYTSSSGSQRSFTISPESCTNSLCQHRLRVSSAADHTVSVAVVNVVGQRRSNESSSIGSTNPLLSVEVDAASSSSSATLQCQFQSGVTGTASCLVQYGSDPSYVNLPFQGQAVQNLTNGGTINVPFSNLQSRNLTLVYYVVLAQTDSQSVRVMGLFRTACAPSDLGGSQMGQLDERCNVYGNSVVVSGGVACYDGSSTGAEAVYLCNDGYELEGEGRRVCQRDGVWNGSVPTCDPVITPPAMRTPFPVWAIAVIVVVVLVMVAVAVTTVILVYFCYYRKKKRRIVDATNKTVRFVDSPNEYDSVELCPSATQPPPVARATQPPPVARANTLITKSLDVRAAAAKGRRRPPPPPPLFEQESWYHGDITGAELEVIFSSAEPGQYVVRASTSRAGGYSVSVKGIQRIHHFLLEVLPTGGRVKIAEEGGTWFEFDSMSALIENYKYTECIIKGDNVFLGEPIHVRESVVASL